MPCPSRSSDRPASSASTPETLLSGRSVKTREPCPDPTRATRRFVTIRASLPGAASSTSPARASKTNSTCSSGRLGTSSQMLGEEEATIGR